QSKQQQWLPCNYRLRIDKLEEACKRVSKIEPLVVKQKVTTNALGEMRVTGIEPTGVDLPNLVITLPEADAEPFWDWEKSFIIQGNCEESDHKTGTLEFLTPDLKDVLFTITMTGIGIFKMTADKLEAGNENIRKVKVEMYVEDYQFKYESGST